MMKKPIFHGAMVLLCVPLFVGCSTGDKHFTGALTMVVSDIRQVEGSFVKHEATLIPMMQINNRAKDFFVCDSLVFFFNNDIKENFVDVYNVKNGQKAGEYLRRGHGKNEFVAITPFSYFYKEDGDMKTMSNAPNEGAFFTWNISKSLEKEADIFDHIVPHDYRKHYHSAPSVLSPYADSLVICTTGSAIYGGTSMTAPEIHLVSRSTGKDTRTLMPLNNPIFNKNSRILSVLFFESFTKMKPDGTKLVNAYCFLPLIAIVDLGAHETHGHMIGKKLDYSVFETDMEEAKFYYVGVACSDNHIFALWNGREAKYDKRTISGFNLLQIFDWDGKLVDVVRLEHEVNDIYFDHFSGELYACSEKSSYLYRVEIPYQ